MVEEVTTQETQETNTQEKPEYVPEKFWNKDLNELSNKQLEYAANDVIFLHEIKVQLENMLKREKRIDVFKKCIYFLDTRVELDQKGFKEDIFEH